MANMQAGLSITNNEDSDNAYEAEVEEDGSDSETESEHDTEMDPDEDMVSNDSASGPDEEMEGSSSSVGEYPIPGDYHLSSSSDVYDSDVSNSEGNYPIPIDTETSKETGVDIVVVHMPIVPKETTRSKVSSTSEERNNNSPYVIKGAAALSLLEISSSESKPTFTWLPTSGMQDLQKISQANSTTQRVYTMFKRRVLARILMTENISTTPHFSTTPSPKRHCSL
ncbi:hypothetical protein COEREDRAFT_9207 [Coemansia reversa NRRL 1564]|uniref:Uncharacterized protein n=1 Tax=Coemansia reversa (strain ATCC 12441 / NRRL 1564) TaxID=763665 RepID=A0A2G5B920_COERN|nr:hypothetical protein COEREDRAFT_9207 [Coemansia reversa NRRL 1564]|eukprot:PIA15501.1 hypothetical protein COEREDRAFT_9207 [Coemansia reversa NRRL 1564]